LRVWAGGGRGRGKEECEASKKPITLLDVMRHTSGTFYPANPANGTPGVQDPFLIDSFLKNGVRQAQSPEEFSRRLAQVPLAHEPGLQFTYSPATALIPVIVEKITGMPYEEYLDEVLLRPLGMRNTGFFLKDNEQRGRLANLYERWERRGLSYDFQEAERKIFTYERGSALNGDGGMFSTIQDYQRFVRWMLSLEDNRIVPKDLKQSFCQTDHLARQGLAMPEDFLGFASGFGLGTYVTPQGLCGWSGLANTHFVCDQRTGRYAIAMAQCLPFSWRWQELMTVRLRRWEGKVGGPDRTKKLKKPSELSAPE